MHIKMLHVTTECFHGEFMYWDVMLYMFFQFTLLQSCSLLSDCLCYEHQNQWWCYFHLSIPQLKRNLTRRVQIHTPPLNSWQKYGSPPPSAPFLSRITPSLNEWHINDHGSKFPSTINIPVQNNPQLEWMASSITDPNFPQQLTFLSRITPSLNKWHQRSQQCLHMCINTQPLLTVLCVLIYILYPCYQVQVLLVNALIINHRSNHWIHIVVIFSSPYLHEKATYKWNKIYYHLKQLEIILINSLIATVFLM